MFLMPYSDDFPYAYPDAHETTHNFTCNDCFPRAESGEWDGIAFAVHSTAAADAMVGESFKLTHVSFGGDEMGGVEKEADFVKLPEYHNTTSAKYIAYRCEQVRQPWTISSTWSASSLLWSRRLSECPPLT